MAPEWLVACPKRPSMLLPVILSWGTLPGFRYSQSPTTPPSLEHWNGGAIAVTIYACASVIAFTFEVFYCSRNQERVTPFVLLIDQGRVHQLMSSFSSSCTIHTYILYSPLTLWYQSRNTTSNLTNTIKGVPN